MLAYLEGRLLEVTENGCVLLTAGGVGYEVLLPSHILKRAGSSVFTSVLSSVRMRRNCSDSLRGMNGRPS